MKNYEVTVTPQAGSIQCDFESAKTYLEDRLKEYDGVLFTEDAKKDAKEAVATLRKEKKAFSDRVKEAKAEYMKPFETFFEQAKELIDLYDRPIGFINGQVAEFEKKRVEEKKQLIRQLYEECISDMSDFLPLTKIYNPKWENATTNQKNIREELMTRKEEAKKAILAIKEMHSDAEEQAISMYRESFDLTKAILYLTQHEKQKAEILAKEQERIRREEEERIRGEERQKLEAQRRAQEEKEMLLAQAQEEKELLLRQAEAEKAAAVEQAKAEAEQEVINSLIPSQEGEKNLYGYRYYMTLDEKEHLETYSDSVGLEWERTDE